MALSFGETASIELLRAALSVVLTAGMDITNRVTGATQKAFTDSIICLSESAIESATFDTNKDNGIKLFLICSLFTKYWKVVWFKSIASGLIPVFM